MLAATFAGAEAAGEVLMKVMGWCTAAYYSRTLE